MKEGGPIGQRGPKTTLDPYGGKVGEKRANSKLGTKQKPKGGKQSSREISGKRQTKTELLEEVKWGEVIQLREGGVPNSEHRGDREEEGVGVLCSQGENRVSAVAQKMAPEALREAKKQRR